MSEKLYEYKDFYDKNPQKRKLVTESIQQDLVSFLGDFDRSGRKIFDRKAVETVKLVFRGFITDQESDRMLQMVTPEVKNRGATILSNRKVGGKNLGMSLFNLLKSRYQGSWDRFFEEMGYNKNEGSVRFAVAPERFTSHGIVNTTKSLQRYPAVQKFYFKKFLQYLEEKKGSDETMVRSPKDLELRPDYGARLYASINKEYKGNWEQFFQYVGYTPQGGTIQFKKKKGAYDRRDYNTQKKYLYKFMNYIKDSNITNPSPSTIINWKENGEPIGNMFYSGVIQRMYNKNYDLFFRDMGVDPKTIGFKKVEEITSENFKKLTAELVVYLKQYHKKGRGPTTIKYWNEAYYQYMIEHYRKEEYDDGYDHRAGEKEHLKTTSPDWDNILTSLIKKPRLIDLFSHVFDENYKKTG